MAQCISGSMQTHRWQPHRDNEASLLEVFHQWDGVLFEVSQAPVDGLGVIIRSSLLLGSFVQPLLQTVVGASQKHHQVRGADLGRAQMMSMKRDGHAPVTIHSHFMLTVVPKRQLQSQGSKTGNKRSECHGFRKSKHDILSLESDS